MEVIVSVGEAFAAHDTVRHSEREYARGFVHANSAESFNDRVRRTIAGVFHHISPEHADLYFNEVGFRWSPAGGFWWRARVSGAADFLAALHRKIGPRRPDGACWGCQSPDGYFRPQGAAAPVYCDACHKARQPQADPLGVDRAYEDSCQDAYGL